MLIRKGMDLSENERLSYITIRHKLKKRSSTSIGKKLEKNLQYGTMLLRLSIFY
jgi:hypothetical protein